MKMRKWFLLFVVCAQMIALSRENLISEFSENGSNLTLKFDDTKIYDELSVTIGEECFHHFVKIKLKLNYAINTDRTFCQMMRFVEGYVTEPGNLTLIFSDIKFQMNTVQALDIIQYFKYNISNPYNKIIQINIAIPLRQPSQPEVVNTNSSHLEIKTLSNKYNEVIQYNLFIFNIPKLQCINSVEFIIMDSNKQIGSKGQKINCDVESKVINTNREVPIYYKLAENEIYSIISVQAANKWGYGPEKNMTLTWNYIRTSKLATITSKSTTTTHKYSTTTYTSMSPEDLIKIMKQEILTNYDKQHQISITLPISALTNEMRFVCVVVSNGPIIIKQGPWINKPDACSDVSYFHCIGKSSCTYEIRVNLPNRQKRQVTNENLPMIIGSMDNCNQSYYCNGKLTAGQTYKIGMRAYSANNYYVLVEIEKKTEPSNLIIIISTVACVGAALVVIVVIVVVAVVITKRKKRDHARPSTSSQSYLTGSTPPTGYNEYELTTPSIQPKLNEYDVMTTSIQPRFNEYDIMTTIKPLEMNEYDYSNLKVQGVQVKNFHQKLNNQKMIEDEFEDIKKYSKKIIENQTVEFIDNDNKQKTRFVDIIPYKHNGVTLQDNEFINASFVCSQPAHWTIKSRCNCDEIFIVTQGPIGDDKPNKLSTVADFWQMVAEQNIDMIVMLTNLSEMKDNVETEKCAKYWPNFSEILKLPFKHNLMSLELEDIRENHIYCDRRIKFKFNNESRTIIQLQLKLWMDYSFPERELFLNFYDTFVSFRDRNLANRTIVHCSAGAGRSCTFILLDVLARSVASPEDYLCLAKSLKDMFQARVEAVQSFEQYLFLCEIIAAWMDHKYLGNRN